MSQSLDDWPALFAYATKLPGAVEGRYYGGPAIMAKASDRPVVTQSREADSFVLHINADYKAMLMELNSARFWETAHYAGYPAVLVRYGDAEEIAEWIAKSLALAAEFPRRKRR